MSDKVRKAFEDWISNPPFEREIMRYPESAAWAGQYKRINVALAWEAWMEALRTTEVKMKRYIVCGGRDFSDWQFMDKSLMVILKTEWNFVIVHGDARGADRMAEGWAKHCFVCYEAHPANWDLYGKKAGGIRNQEMLDTGVDGVIAFPGGYGTADMVRRAEQAGVLVWDLR